MINRRVFAIAALLTLQAVVIWWRIRGSCLFSDDFLNFMLYDDIGFKWSYLFRDVFGQIAPGYRAVQALYFELFGVSYFGCAVILGALSMLSTLFLILIGERARAPRWSIACAAIVHVFLLPYMHSQEWWSTALHTIPSTAATMAALWCLVGPDGKGPTRRGRIAAALCFALALTFTARPLFAPIFLVAVLVHLHRKEGAAWRAAVGTTVSDLLYFIPVAIAYALMVLKYQSPTSPPRPSTLTAVMFVWKALSDGTIASTLGLGTHGLPLAHDPSVAIALLLTVAFAAFAIRTQRSAAILWAGFVTYVAVAMGMIAIHRAGVFGSDAGLSLRYHVEGATFLLLVFMLSSSAFRPSRLGQRIAVALSALVALNLQMQSSRVVHLFDVASACRYVGQLHASLKELRGKPGVVFLDAILPEVIVPAWMMPYNTTSKFLPLFTKSYPFAGPDRATYVLGDDGRVKPR